MKRLIIAFTFIIAVCTQCAEAKQKEVSAADSLAHAKAIELIESGEFAVIAERLSVNGISWSVNDSYNFLAHNDNKAMYQIAPFYGKFDGATLRGHESGYKVNKKEKKGKQPTYSLSFNVNGAHVASRIYISLSKTGNDVNVHITPIYGGTDITMYGKIYPLENYPILIEELKRP